jgi:hypothetical protein
VRCLAGNEAVQIVDRREAAEDSGGGSGE